MFQDNNVIYQFRGPLGVPVEIGASVLLLAFVFVGYSFNSVDDLIWSLIFFAMVMGSIFLH